jgi:hypothetical protein
VARFSFFLGMIPRPTWEWDMPHQLVLRDRTNGRPPDTTLIMQWQESVPLTPRMLISERVRMEWETREAEREAKARGALAPLVDVAMMRRLNPYRESPASTTEAAPVTLESVTGLALDGFRRNAFFLVVDGQQATDLDMPIQLRPTSEVTFVRLVPLKGG